MATALCETVRKFEAEDAEKICGIRRVGVRNPRRGCHSSCHRCQLVEHDAVRACLSPQKGATLFARLVVAHESKSVAPLRGFVPAERRADHRLTPVASRVSPPFGGYAPPRIPGHPHSKPWARHPTRLPGAEQSGRTRELLCRYKLPHRLAIPPYSPKSKRPVHICTVRRQSGAEPLDSGRFWTETGRQETGFVNWAPCQRRERDCQAPCGHGPHRGTFDAGNPHGCSVRFGS